MIQLTRFTKAVLTIKIYQDLKERYWWYGMKCDVAAHVALCDVALSV